MSSPAVLRRPAPGDGSAAVGTTLGLFEPGPAARVVTIRAGRWEPRSDPRLLGTHLPLLVVEGAVQRSVGVRGRVGADLLGPGDMVRIEDDDGMFETRFRTLTVCRVAVLDDRVRAGAAVLPSLVCALSAAAVQRAGVLAGQIVLAQLVAIDDRLRILFPSLADRWGRVTADGVLLPAFLSHTVLSALVGARRPSLTAAVARLVDEGTVRRLPDRRWLLTPALAAVAA